MTATESTERGLGGGKDISVYSVAESYKKQIWFSINEESLRYLKLKNYEKCLVYIEADNIPSIKSFESVGFYHIKIIICLRIFKFKRIK